MLETLIAFLPYGGLLIILVNTMVLCWKNRSKISCFQIGPNGLNIFFYHKTDE